MGDQSVLARPNSDNVITITLDPKVEEPVHSKEVESEFFHVFFLLRRELILVSQSIGIRVRHGLWWNHPYDEHQSSNDEYCLHEDEQS